MVNRPVTEKEPRRRAWPLASSVTRATTVLPTKNVTVPVGVPVPEGPRTVAVNVTACPTLAGFADATRAVVVALWAAGAFTCSVRVCELDRKLKTPPAKVAVMTWLPAVAKLVVNVAVLLSPVPTVARTTLPSMKTTLPIGVAAPGATADTVAVKVTAWPVTAGLSDDRRASLVAAWLTVSVTAAEVLSVKPEPRAPPKEAVSQWLA